MGQPRPVAILVAYHNTHDLSQALDALATSCDLLVVDNGLEDAARDAARACCAEYVRPEGNVGFAAAVNIGLRRRVGRDVLLVNPDARVTPEVVQALQRELLNDPYLCAVAPRLRGHGGHPQQVEWPMPSPREEWVKAFRLQRFLPPRQTFLIGAVLLLRSAALDDVGEFDERFFLYAEESDWQLRALRRGWRTRVVESAVAEHAGAGSSDVESRRQQHFHHSAELFALKWYGRTGWRSMRAASYVRAGLRLLLTLPNPRRRADYARQLRL